MWVTKFVKGLLIRFFINVLKCGPLPKHFAFILDGNRRFAEKLKLKNEAGYNKAIDKVEKVEGYCRSLDVREMSIYIFSLENLKRSREEVDILLDLAAKNQIKCLSDPRVQSHGIKEIVIGDLELIPGRVRKLLAQGMLATLHHDKLRINVAMFYTSANEITAAIKIINEGVRTGMLKIDDINEQLIDDCLFTNKGINPDMLIRTSGETRLSDFLLWQSGFTQIFFLEPFWPKLTLWDIVFTVFNFQQRQQALNDVIKSMPTDERHNSRVRKFLEHLEITRLNKIKEYANEDCSA